MDTALALAPVVYRFAMAGKPWVVRRATIEESIGQCYVARVELLADGDELDLDAWIGTHAELTIARGDEARAVVGVVLALEHRGRRADGTRLHVEIGPALALLAHRVRSRVFQELTVPEIVARVLGDVFDDHRRRLDATRLREDHGRRDYCVQHRESDLAFVQRLLEEEGIGYLFAHEPEGEVMILVDELDAGAAELSDLPLHRDDVLLGAREGLVEFTAARRVRPARASVRQWDWRSARPDGWDQHDDDERASAAERRLVVELFDDVRAPDGLGPELARVGERRAIRRRHASSSAARRAAARGNAIACTPGSVFTLHGHDDPSLDRRWRIVRVRHEGDAPEAARGEAQGARPDYENVLECVLAELPWRPEQTIRKPRIAGVQLATVTAPGGAEIHTDALGRIQVCMHWDREGRDAHARGETSATSCWLRVIQSWAGAGFGAQFVPRVGMEVLVSFIDGDPDQPVCVGCVGNGGNGNAFVASEAPTTSGLRTASSPGGQGFNELSFTDEAGAERVFLHAQRDLTQIALGDHVEDIGGDQTRSVGGDRRGTVVGNEHETIEGDRIRVVQGGEQVTVLGGQRVLVMGGPSKADAAAPAARGAALNVQGNYVVEADARIELRCGASSIVLTPTEILLNAPARMVVVTAPTSITLEPGMLTAFSPQTMLIGGASTLGLADEARMSGGTAARVETCDSSLVLDTDAALHAQVVTLEAESALGMSAPECTLAAGGTLVLNGVAEARLESPAAVTLTNGPGGAKLDLKGGLVSMNE